MGFEASKRNWERLAQADPLWAVCTDPDKRHGRWDAGAFFATGEREVEAVFSYLDGRGLRPGDYDRGLDFGCGVGRLTRALSRRLAHVVGVDVSETMIRKARELSPHLEGRVEWVVNGDADLGRFPDGSFSFVYSSIVLQHIPWPQSLAYVGEMMRVLKPGGLLVFQVPTLDRTPLVLRGPAPHGAGGRQPDARPTRWAARGNADGDARNPAGSGGGGSSPPGLCRAGCYGDKLRRSGF